MKLEEEVGVLLKKKSKKIAVSESCTGGLFMHRLTNVAGSSTYFLGGIVAYKNEIKSKFLNVEEELLQTQGAISEECAQKMATSIARLFGADIGVAITGVAGPESVEGKPVGLVYIAVYENGKTFTTSFLFKGEREKIKEEAVNEALRLLASCLRET